MLDRELENYNKLNIYPFHMPGHKRVSIGDFNPYDIDITEIEGFDNLHNAKGLIREGQREAAEMYHAKESFYLVNGSTCGLLAAISAVCDAGDEILIARNCHKAVYNAIYLRKLRPTYIYPKLATCGISGEINPDQVRELVAGHDFKAVVITSPTYDGITSDIKAIGEIVHDRNIPLIVDCAHGAHYGFSDDFPENPIVLGADVVIISLHKTMPCFTQSALLNINGSRISVDRIRRFLAIYETSSPSYILMAGIDKGLRYVRENREVLFKQFKENLDWFYKEAEKLKHLRTATEEDFKGCAREFDRSKILILTNNTGISGQILLDKLLKEHNIMLEMAAGNYGLALATMMDSREGFRRLIEALVKIDQSLEYTEDKAKIDSSIYRPMEKRYEISEAMDGECVSVLPEEARGRVSGAFINLYPPGIPLVVPGEVIDEKLVDIVKLARQQNMDLQGLTEDNRLIILKG